MNDCIAVGLDVDGVVANFLGYTYPKAGISLEHTDWDVPEDKEEQVRALCNDPATWVSLEPMPNAKAALNLIYTATGVVPVFISSMPEKFVVLRTWWLEKHFGTCLPYIEFYSRSSADKPQLAKDLMLTHFVEDKRTTANAMAMARLTSVLVPSPYYNDGDIHPSVQVKSLTEFARDLQTLKEAA